jgi:hypothetical protein
MPEIICTLDHHDWPRITLVTPSLNQGAYIEETIRSVLQQEYPNLELIVIDGGSTDDTVSTLMRYSQWIDYWVSEPDNGQSDAINKGLALATGEWFNWLNSDDYLQPGALFALARATQKQDAVCVSGRTSNLCNGHIFSSYQANVPAALPDFLFSLRVNQPGSLLHVESVREVGGIRDDLRMVMDLDLWLRLGMTYGPQAFHFIDQQIAVYRYHSASKTCSAEDVFAPEEFALLTQLARSLGVDVPDSLRQLAAECGITAYRGSVPAINLLPADVESAWLDRMVVSDSLLFRALRALRTDSGRLPDHFLGLLNSLEPLLKHHSSLPSSRWKSQALVHASQILGRIPLGWLPSILWLDFRISTIRSFLRLMLRS